MTRSMASQQHRHSPKKKRRVDTLPETCAKKDSEETLRLLNTAPVASQFSEMKDNVSCAICQADVMCDPQLMTKCGHSFCKTCLEKKDQYGTSNGICPSCRKGSDVDPNRWVPNISLAKVIDSIKFMCPCCCEAIKSETTYSRTELRNHLDKCPYRRHKCMVPGCGAMLLPHEVDEHNRENAETHLQLALGACEKYENKLKDVQERHKEMASASSLVASTGGLFYSGLRRNGYGVHSKQALHVPSESHPTVESAYRAIVAHHLCGIITVGPGTFEVGLEIDIGSVTILGTTGSDGERLTKLEYDGPRDTLLCRNVGTSVTLVDLEIHQCRRENSSLDLTRSFEAIVCDNGCEVTLHNCCLSSMSGPAISSGLITAAMQNRSGVVTPVTKLWMEKCRVDNCPIGDALLLTGRFKATVTECVFHGSNNGIQAWVTPWDRTVCTVLVKDTVIKQFRHRALFLKYEQFMHPLPNWQDKSLNPFCIFTIENVSVNTAATQLDTEGDNPVCAAMMEYKNIRNRDAILWFAPACEPHFGVTDTADEDDEDDEEDDGDGGMGGRDPNDRRFEVS